MKNLLLIAGVVLLSFGAGYWIATQRVFDSSPNAPDHSHQLVAAKDTQDKSDYTSSMHPQVRSDKPGQCPIRGMPLIQKTEATAVDPAAASAGERKPLYWYDPMKPDQHFDKPGKSPFMDMQLVPMYAEASSEDSDVIAIDPRIVQNLGIRTAVVERRTVTRELRTAGSIAVNENRIEVVQTRAAGWVEKLHVRALNDTVRKGQLLAEIYAPDLYAAQQEYVLASRAQDAALVAAARQRLRLLGLSEAQVARLDKTGEAQRRIAYTAPVDGIVTELGVRDGAQINPGMSLYTLADLSKVWVTAEVPEAQAANLLRGAPIEATLAALPDRRFSGRIDYIYPAVNPQTRTVRVRTALDNPELLLKPGMFADIVLGGGQVRDALMTPSEALIRTGARTMVIVAEAEGRFRPVEVRLGVQRDGHTEVLAGLQDGQKVVVSGQFLIDSEANLRGAFGKLESAKTPAEAADSEKHP